MRSEPELAAAANANFLASFGKLAEHSAEGEVREAEGAFAFITGFPIPLFNGCVVAERSQPGELRAALGWVRERHVPYRLWIAEGTADELGAVAAEFRLERDSVSYPNMVLDPVPEPPRPAEDVVAGPVGTAGLEDFLDVSVELGLSRELAERVFSSGFVADPDVQLFTGWLEGRPAGTSLAIRSGGVSGVYNVGVVPAARRRGVGTALTWASVGAGRAWQCEPVVLQSSTMALPMYEAMGFRTVVSYAVFRES
jgi:ribosomal protein S18 acetylase RimI-like enzyme